MDSENPFDLIQLPEELIKESYHKGKLEELLKGWKLSVNKAIHPDPSGGDVGSVYLGHINESIGRIRTAFKENDKGKIRNWVVSYTQTQKKQEPANAKLADELKLRNQKITELEEIIRELSIDFASRVEYVETDFVRRVEHVESGNKKFKRKVGLSAGIVSALTITSAIGYFIYSQRTFNPLPEMHEIAARFTMPPVSHKKEIEEALAHAEKRCNEISLSLEESLDEHEGFKDCFNQLKEAVSKAPYWEGIWWEAGGILEHVSRAQNYAVHRAAVFSQALYFYTQAFSIQPERSSYLILRGLLGPSSDCLRHNVWCDVEKHSAGYLALKRYEQEIEDICLSQTALKAECESNQSNKTKDVVKTKYINTRDYDNFDSITIAEGERFSVTTKDIEIGEREMAVPFLSSVGCEDLFDLSDDGKRLVYYLRNKSSLCKRSERGYTYEYACGQTYEYGKVIDADFWEKKMYEVGGIDIGQQDLPSILFPGDSTQVVLSLDKRTQVRTRIIDFKQKKERAFTRDIYDHCQLSVSADGNTVACAHPFLDRIVVADIQKETLKELLLWRNVYKTKESLDEYTTPPGLEAAISGDGNTLVIAAPKPVWTKGQIRRVAPPTDVEYALFVADPHRDTAAQITEGKGIRYLSIAADGRTIAFQKYNGKEDRIYVARIATPQAREGVDISYQVEDIHEGFSPRLSSSGTELAFRYEQKLYVENLTDRIMTEITEFPKKRVVEYDISFEGGYLAVKVGNGSECSLRRIPYNKSPPN